MATLTVRNLDEDVVRRLRIRAAEHGRSAESEHREILRTVLIAGDDQQARRREAVERFAEFRRRTGGRGGPSVIELLEESRNERLDALTKGQEGA